jgi:hypothetical protein
LPAKRLRIRQSDMIVDPPVDPESPYSLPVASADGAAAAAAVPVAPAAAAPRPLSWVASVPRRDSCGWNDMLSRGVNSAGVSFVWAFVTPRGAPQKLDSMDFRGVGRSILAESHSAADGLHKLETLIDIAGTVAKAHPPVLTANVYIADAVDVYYVEISHMLFVSRKLDPAGALVAPRLHVATNYFMYLTPQGTQEVPFHEPLDSVGDLCDRFEAVRGMAAAAPADLDSIVEWAKGMITTGPIFHGSTLQPPSESAATLAATPSSSQADVSSAIACTVGVVFLPNGRPGVLFATSDNSPYTEIA